jgi:hypothetical protein
MWLFNGENPSVMKCKATFKREFHMLIHRAKTSSVPSSMEEWLHNLNCLLWGHLAFLFISFYLHVHIPFVLFINI